MEVVLPKFGVSMEEAFIVEWYKQEGDAVKKGDLLAAIETDKVRTDLECPVSGILTTHVADLEEPVKVGEVVAIIEES